MYGVPAAKVQQVVDVMFVQMIEPVDDSSV